MKKVYTAPLAEMIVLACESFLSVSGEVLGEDGFNDAYGKTFG